MKRKLIIGGAVAAIIFGGTMVAGASNKEIPTVTISQPTIDSSIISIEKAKNIALEKVSGKMESIKLESKKGKYVYEAEIQDGSIEYEVSIDAVTGMILKVEKEIDFDGDDQSQKIPTVTTPENNQNQTKDPVKNIEQSNTDNKIEQNKNSGKQSNPGHSKVETSMISTEKAIQLAESAVKGRVVEMELDEDDGKWIYEFELVTASGEAEVEIDAVTGEILDVEYDD